MSADAETLAAVAAAARQRGAQTLLVSGQTPADGLAWVERLVRAAEGVGLLVVGVEPDQLTQAAPEGRAPPLTLVPGPPLGYPPAGFHPSWQARLDGSLVAVRRRDTRRAELDRAARLLTDLGLAPVGVLWDDAGLTALEDWGGLLWDRALAWVRRPAGRWALAVLALVLLGLIGGTVARRVVDARESEQARLAAVAERAPVLGRPVTRRAFGECVGRAVCPGLPPEPADEAPVTGITRPAAVAYCSDRGARLPTAAEALRLQRQVGGLTFEWTSGEREGRAVVIRDAAEALRLGIEPGDALGFRCVPMDGIPKELGRE